MTAGPYPEDSVGELMGPPVGVVPESMRLPEAIGEIGLLGRGYAGPPAL